MPGLATSRDSAAIRKMADLLRAGAAMLAERCPSCGLPLFRLRSGEVICPNHGRVQIVRDEAELSRVAVQSVLEELEKLAASRVNALMVRAQTDEDEALDHLVRWLEILERVERILAAIASRQPAAEGAVQREKGEGEKK
ncbi:MAG: Sjogren's syndrome/scleroderma autoantigen 1 family protein [Thermoproteota archaeon]